MRYTRDSLLKLKMFTHGDLWFKLKLLGDYEMQINQDRLCLTKFIIILKWLICMIW